MKSKNNQRFTPFLRTAHGFSLVEIMVVLGLLALIATGIAGVITNGVKQQKGIQAKDQQREITSEIRLLLTESLACRNSFAAAGQKPAAAFSVNSIKDFGNVIRYQKDTPDKTGLLMFKKFEISGFNAVGSSASEGISSLKVSLSKIADTGTAKDVAPDVISLKVTVDGSGDLVDCYSVGGQTNGFWQASPAPNSNNIYFSAGSVGIGISTPTSILHVVGNTQIAGQLSTGVQSITTDTLDWNNGNTISTTFNCATDLALNNLRDGGSYRLIVTNNGTTKCNFAPNTTGIDAASVTYWYKPNNNLRLASSRSVYNLTRAGNDVYINWDTGYYSASTINLVISSNTTNYNIRNAALAAGWDGISSVTIMVTVNTGVVVSSTNLSTPGMATGTLPSGSTLTIDNNGSIYGWAGNSGVDKTVNQGWEGGPALRIDYQATVNNAGLIVGGLGNVGATDGDSCGGCGGGNGGSNGGEGGPAIVFNAAATVTNSNAIYGAGGGGASGGGAFAAGIGSGSGGQGEGAIGSNLQPAGFGQTTGICGGGFGGNGGNYGLPGSPGGDCGNGAANGGPGGYAMILNGRTVTLNGVPVAANSSYVLSSWIAGAKGRIAP